MRHQTIKDYEEIISHIKQLNYENLSFSIIENIICEFGLFPAHGHKPYFAKDGIPGYYIKHIADGELSLWQKPNELARSIYHLVKHYTVDSFLEIGTHRAGTFIIVKEFLQLKNKNLFSLTIDPYSKINKNILQVFNINHLKTTIDTISDSFDLIFIDGNHSYNYVKNDYHKSLNLKPKILMFHDINSDRCPDVVKFWNEIKNNHKNYYEFIDQQPAMGIGILEI